MQISSFHEKCGDTVEWYSGGLFDSLYDEVYASKIFQFSKMPELPERAKIGGTGIDFTNVLPPEMASELPSYTLYPDCTFHLGFSMKGCRFRCKFCCVPQKEGRPRHNATIANLLRNPNGENRLMLLDNDFFGGPDWKLHLEEIVRTDLHVCFVQGLNIRILTEEQAGMLAKCRFYTASFERRRITFAWDRYRDRQMILDGIDRCVKAGIKPYEMQFFVLIGFDTTHEENYERVTLLKELGCDPFVMPYNRADPYQKRFARWVNHRAVFKSVNWQDYRPNARFEEQQQKLVTGL